MVEENRDAEETGSGVPNAFSYIFSISFSTPRSSLGVKIGGRATSNEFTFWVTHNQGWVGLQMLGHKSRNQGWVSNFGIQILGGFPSAVWSHIASQMMDHHWH